MTDAFENKLRNALKPVDPGEDFTKDVMARVAEGAKSNEPSEKKAARLAVPAKWLAVAMAASVVVAVIVGVRVREEQEREAGVRAGEQLREALKVTSEKLNLAYRVVHDQSQDSRGEKSQSAPKVDTPDRSDHSGV